MIFEKAADNLSVNASKMVLFLFFVSQSLQQRQCLHTIARRRGLSENHSTPCPYPAMLLHYYDEGSAYILLHASVRTLADWRHSLECINFPVLYVENPLILPDL